MFRALTCPSSGWKIVFTQHLVSSLSANGCTVHLITHFAAEIMLIAFLNQGCEKPSSGFKCHLTADVAECIRWICALSWHGGTNTTHFWDGNTLSSGQQPAEDCQSRDYEKWQLACYIMTRIPLTGPQWLTYVGMCGHIVWCKAKGVGDREILESYSNSASKIHQKQTFFLMEQNLCWPV